MNDPMNHAATVLRRCDELATFSEEEGRLTRRFATPALRAAGERLREWMEAAGLETRSDAVGNVIGRLGGEGQRTLLIGSHFDTVPDAGRYDGALGVLVAIACLEQLRDEGRSLPYALEVMAFADEEGVRYGTGYLGSSVVAGAFQDIALRWRDAEGITLADALRSFGGDPERLSGARRDPDGLIGYYEVHIEQGPVLESEGAALGVVRAIAGQSRARLTFTGGAGHAGTVPMALRRDALSAAAEFICAVEALARAEDGVVATVGEIEVQPGASNVIPGHVALSLDVRHADDRVREMAVKRLLERAHASAGERGCSLGWQLAQDTQAVSCSETLTRLVAQAVQEAGQPVIQLTSGAGHDAVMLSKIAPVAMLFVRCAGGVSHSPAESVLLEDVAAAIEATTRFLELVA